MNATATATALQFPALNGEVVTEAHARICADKGHATHRVDGVDQGMCPRCGESTIKVDDTKLFTSILKLEDSVKGTKWSVQARATGLISPAYQGRFAADKMAEQMETLTDKLKRDTDRLFTMIGNLTPGQLKAFGEYRRNRWS